jgi:YbbR domain-containing protein
LGNLRLKLLAIFFAISLWAAVAYTSNPTQNHSYKMTVANAASVPSGLVLIGAAPAVTVTVTGTADNLTRFDPRDLRVTGNFSNVKVGNNQVPIRVDNGDPDVLVDAPATVPVRIDQLSSVNVNVSIERINALVTGYHEDTGQTSVTPGTVRVDGPKSL